MGSLPHLARRPFFGRLRHRLPLPSGPVGNLTRWAFHEVQEHPNRSSNEGDVTFRSWRSCVVNFDEHCSWTTPVGRPLFMDDPSWTTPIGRPLFDDPSWTTLFDNHCSWTTTVHDHCLMTPLGRHCLTTTVHGRPLFMTTV